MLGFPLRNLGHGLGIVSCLGPILCDSFLYHLHSVLLPREDEPCTSFFSLMKFYRSGKRN